jgi:hypothetical protein
MPKSAEKRTERTKDLKDLSMEVHDCAVPAAPLPGVDKDLDFCLAALPDTLIKPLRKGRLNLWMTFGCYRQFDP